jgi:uncharacterized protein (TIGR02145 family)
MKALKLFSLLVCICVSTLNAQTIMNIHQSNGAVLQIPLNAIDSITYTINNPGNLATLSTLPIGNTTGTSATSGGNITNDGGTNITQRGVVWSTTQNPTTANNLSTNGSGTGSFTSNLTGLTANTTYYVRSYATNSAGTAYGNQLSFTTTGGGSGIVSNPGAGVTYGGYNYPTVVLGNGQEWMAQNLNTTQYNDGTPIPIVSDNQQWMNNGIFSSNPQPMMCWYNNDQATYAANTFGALYNWYAVNPSANGNRNVCPVGWHVPSDEELNVLIGYLDPSFITDANGVQSNTAGGKMKSTGTQYWLAPNTDASNESGFSGLPGGLRGWDFQYFNEIGINGHWWSSTEVDEYQVWSRTINCNYGFAYRNLSGKTYAFSVRCLRD